MTVSWKISCLSTWRTKSALITQVKECWPGSGLVGWETSIQPVIVANPKCWQVLNSHSKIGCFLSLHTELAIGQSVYGSDVQLVLSHSNVYISEIKPSNLDFQCLNKERERKKNIPHYSTFILSWRHPNWTEHPTHCAWNEWGACLPLKKLKKANGTCFSLPPDNLMLSSLFFSFTIC